MRLRPLLPILMLSILLLSILYSCYHSRNICSDWTLANVLLVLVQLCCQCWVNLMNCFLREAWRADVALPKESGRYTFTTSTGTYGLTYSDNPTDILDNIFPTLLSSTPKTVGSCRSSLSSTLSLQNESWQHRTLWMPSSFRVSMNKCSNTTGSFQNHYIYKRFTKISTHTIYNIDIAEE